MKRRINKNYLGKLINKGLLLFIAILLTMTAACNMFSGPGYKGNKSDHFDGEKFHNQDGDRMSSFTDLLKWQLTRKESEWKDYVTTDIGPAPPPKAAMGELRVTFVNHSTVLIQMDSLNILTDPVWSYRISPVSWIGPTRHRPPGIKFEDLPHIDIVLISHNHYDHCDIPTLKRLEEKFHPEFLVPLGVKALLLENDIKNVREMDWWQDERINQHTVITMTPARHFSMRGLIDRNTTLWSSYVIQSENGPVFFGGDTGFGIHFEQIFKKFGPMRFSLLPIGAFKPQWFMKPVHESPAEAVQAHKILHSQVSMGIHFGTFRQADDKLMEPVKYLDDALKTEHMTNRDFLVPVHGKGYELPPLKNYLAPSEINIENSTR